MSELRGIVIRRAKVSNTRASKNGVSRFTKIMNSILRGNSPPPSMEGRDAQALVLIRLA